MNAIESLELSATQNQHEHELTVTVGGQLVEKEFVNALNNVQRVAKHKGFRPGKMPKNLVLSFYGAEVKEKLMKKLYEQTFEPACKEKDITPISEPKLVAVTALEQDKPFTYRAVFQIKPKVDRPEFMGLPLEMRTFTFEETDVLDELNNLRENMATFVEPADRLEIKECDLVQCDSDVSIDGVINKDYSHKDYAVPLFAENVPNDLKAALIGKKVSEQATVDYTMPEDHQDEALSGKVCTMHLTIRSFKERVLPQLDDDFAKDLSDKFTSLNDLKESIQLRFTITKKRRDEYYRQDAIAKALVQKNPLDVPPVLVERMALSIINRELESMGKKAADELVKNHWQELWQSVQERAEFRVKAELLFEALINALNVEASAEEIAARQDKAKGVAQEDVAYSIQVDKLLSLIEKEANVSVTKESLFKKSNE